MLLEDCIKLSLRPEEVHELIKEYIKSEYSDKNNRYVKDYYKSWCAVFSGNVFKIEPDDDFLQQI